MKYSSFIAVMLCGVLTLVIACRNDKVIDKEAIGTPDCYPEVYTGIDPDTVVTKVTKLPELIVCLDKIADESKHYIITLYREQDVFLQRSKRFKELDLVFESGKTCITIEIPYGFYAIAVFNDANGNDKLDTNTLGMPAEGYGFSAVKGTVLKVPLYKDCQFEFAPNATQCIIKMRHTQ